MSDMDTDDLLTEYDIGSLGAGSRGKYLGRTSDDACFDDDERALRQIKVSLGALLKATREASGIPRAEVASLINSSESFVAALEVGEAESTVDRLIMALLAVGASPEQIGDAFARRSAA